MNRFNYSHFSRSGPREKRKKAKDTKGERDRETKNELS